MKHLIICREFPPAPGGGIGTYAVNMSRLLAEHGETVHVISQRCEQAERACEEMCGGRLIVHRVAFDDWTALLGPRPHPALPTGVESRLFRSNFHPQSFAWSAAILAERLVLEEGVDVIEAQEYEAPLYYFQLRRALDLGPSRQPPTVVHLHSPTAMIAESNEWRTNSPSVVAASRLEEYSIRAADGIMCPSRYLARGVQAHYELPSDSIDVIPYPGIGLAKLDRDSRVWSGGTICYVGRLEPRKGVLEWISAAVSVAKSNPEVTFDFVGENVLGHGRRSGRAVVNEMIPKHLRSRFRFHGAHPRSAIPRFLARARIAVVPSRWENFPNTCIEAMSSGLPVIATSTGGMAEMIEDERTGWIAAGASAIADALTRALSCSSQRLEEMGEAASVSIRERCDPQKVVEKQLAVRARFVDSGAVRSSEIPGNLNWLDPAVSERSFSLEDASSICEITQTMIAAEDAGSGGNRVRSQSAGVRAAIGDPMRTGAVVLRKLRGKFLRCLRQGRAPR
ncbi:MAG: glycosyltransferase family 4 protein [Planctomycetaceae bacterium]